MNRGEDIFLQKNRQIAKEISVMNGMKKIFTFSVLPQKENVQQPNFFLRDLLRKSSASY